MKIIFRYLLRFYSKLLFLCLSLMFVENTNARALEVGPDQSRVSISLNENWKFIADPEKKYTAERTAGLQWETVSFPHTWNSKDVMDDKPGYYRGIGWYKKTINLNSSLKDRKLYLYFNGANQEIEVYVNGKKAGSHVGGYTRFCIPVTDYLIFNNEGSANEIVIKVDNSHNDHIPPLSADFTFFGGIYRNVYLVSTDKVSFDLMDYGSNGVYIHTPAVNKGNASVTIRSELVNNATAKRKVVVNSYLKDRSGNTVAQVSKVIDLKNNERTTLTQHITSFKNPHLWSPEDTYLYTVVSRIYDAKNKNLLDEVVNPLGFRWFSFDPLTGFSLNGHPYKLIGTSRHQDFENLGNALPDELQVRDMQLLKEMGGNFLRIAHYPQDPIILEMCDQLGLLSAVEIPLVNAITESEEFYTRCREMQKEMIRQNFNHPSIILWAYMNEVLLKPKFENDQPRQEQYFANITRLAKNLEDLTRKEDPSRYTFIANHGAYDKYNKIGLTSIPMVIGWNLYQGWYSDQIEGFASFLDRFHSAHPTKPMLITEYGADADPRLRTFNPLRFDKTVEYAAFYHEVYLSEILKRPFVAGAAVWNLADFNSEQRQETMPHINNKGLLNWDRSPKDIYYFYQAALLKEPFLKIASRAWNIRAGIAGKGANVCRQTVRVYTNSQAVRMKLNGKDLGLKSAKDHVCEWEIPFVQGNNLLEAESASDSERKDFAEIHFDVIPENLNANDTAFTGLNVLLGSKRYYIDKLTQEVWIPDQSYRHGSWGSVGGKPFILNNGNKDSYGTDRNILGTGDDPIFQTQQVGIKEYRLDVPDGQYNIALYFAELTGGKIATPLPYNLNEVSRLSVDTVRSFNVVVNGRKVIVDFDISAQAGTDRGIIKKTKVYAEGGKGISIVFEPLKAEPVLNALKIRRVW